MELTYDWKIFQSFFESKRKSGVVVLEPARSIYLVVEDEKILSIFSEGDDLSDWIGLSYLDLAAQISHRELILFNRNQVDEWNEELLSFTHFYDQNEHLKQKAIPQVLARSRFKKSSKGLVLKPAGSVSPARHFLLEALQSWWVKVMPSAFGVFIRLENRPDRSGDLGASKSTIDRELFLIVRRGKIDLFCEPDLSALGNDRIKQSSDVVKYLSEKYLVPVQGIFLPSNQWQAWSECEDPWREVRLSLRGGKNASLKLVPARLSAHLLLYLRSYIGV